MGQKDIHITVYSDYVCPFCHIGRRSLEEYQEARDRELVIDWLPVDDGKDDAYFDQVGRNVARLKDEYGADEMRSLDELPEKIDSFDAQVASFYVKDEHPDRWLAFDEAIFEALWIEGRDIGEIEVLTELAEAVGLDGGEIRRAVMDDDLHDRVRAQCTGAQRHGVTGVQTFAYDGFAARGAVPPEPLARLVESS